MITATAMRLARRTRRTVAVLPHRISDRHDALRAPRLAGADLVTLDVFDTALLRGVARPIDVFWLTAWRLKQRTGAAVDIDDIAHARIEAERAAREQAREAGRHEVTLAEIYQLHACDPALRPALLEEELATERDVCYANPDILALYASLRARGTAVAFISDTYLPAVIVTDLLVNAGYSGADRIFASSTYGLSKAHGSLYGVVAAATGADPRRIWHIGDNPAADTERARAAGWNALWYRPRLAGTPTTLPTETGEARIVASLLAGIPASLRAAHPPRQAQSCVWRDIGIDVAGPIYLGFAQFVATRARQDKLARMAFCARDGRIIREVYQRLQKTSPDLPPSCYLLVSRRALVFPMLEQIGAAELDFLTAQFASLRVDEVLSRIGIDAKDYVQEIARAALTPDGLIESSRDMQALHRLLQDLAPAILLRAARERVQLIAYLRQECCFDTPSLGFVDVGWQGSLQKAAAQLFALQGHAMRLHGLYFGTNPNIRAIGEAAGAATGWFVDAGTPADRYHLTRTQWAVLELLFTALHGSVLGYETSGTGHVEAVLDEGPAGEIPDYERAAGAIQAAALSWVDRYIAAFGGVPPARIDAALVAPRLERLVLAPTLAEACAIGDLFHVDGLGATRTGQHIARPPQGGWMKWPAPLVQGYRRASWRRGYLVRACGGTHFANAAIGAITLLRPGFKSA